ncbi:amidohydrolase family protein [Pseudomonas sp. S36]|uniref:amidohydrolase family protein n=1 Tax=Pseudomonas sp. S36 TaxID=2767447 RepID=UPI0019128FC9|nr:amidohydrolase family protein [Pseudomonas sp. S36]MBK4989134.1 amidohydrolase family protein [Pseudomonas sp. S36]
MSLSRRRFLQAAGAISASAAMGALAKVPYSAGDGRPQLVPPAGSVDCHMHLYDSRVPAAPGATLLPPDASLEDYRQLQQRLGIHRMVIVTPSTYGTDNRVMLDGLLRSRGDARGVAVVASSVTDAELDELNRAGVRGIRFNLSVGTQALDGIERLAARVGELGWNVQVATGPLLPEVAPRLSKLPGRLVIDHLGHVPQPEGLASHAFSAMSDLLDRGNTWVKLSAPYLRSQTGGPGYQDVGVVASRLIERFPEHMLWGSDWPHPTLAEQNKPDDSALLDALLQWAPDEAIRRKILRDNPMKLYGFTAV